MAAEIAAIFQVAKAASDWASRVAANAKEADQRRTAFLLRDAGILVAALRLLHQEVHAVVRSMRAYRDDWAIELRESLAERVLALGSPPVLHSVEEALGSLSEWSGALGEEIRRRRWWTWRRIEARPVAGGGTSAAVEVLLVSGMAYLDWFTQDEMDTIVPSIASALLDRSHVLTEVQVRASAEQLLQQLQQDLPLPEINRAFGKLRADAVRRYPKMEEPDWAALLVASPSVG
jgi:hypothetical protein